MKGNVIMNLYELINHNRYTYGLMRQVQ